MPIGYYGPLRFAICACAALYAYAAWNENRIGKALAVAFVLLALLFNPVVPVRLSRSTWFYFNVGGAALFAVGMLFAMLKGRR